MKRDRKKGSRPEYEDLLYDETPSVVVYYPSKGGDESAPEPTIKRDRSTAFVPDLSELEPLTREQPVVEADASSVTALFPGRVDPVVDPAKPVPPGLQNRGVLAWDPTHRDPGEEDSFSSFFRQDSQAPLSANEPAANEPATNEPASGVTAPAPVMPPATTRPAAREAAPPASSLRPVVFETDIIAADFIEADAIRADTPAHQQRRTIIEELPSPDALDDDGLDDDRLLDGELEPVDEEAPGFLQALAPVHHVASADDTPDDAPVVPADEDGGPVAEVLGRPVEVITTPDAELPGSAAQVIDEAEFDEIAPAMAGLAGTEADFSSIDLDGPDTQMRFLQEWEADVTGTHEAHLSNHTGRLFRSLRAHPQPETLPALRRDQAARFRSLASSQDSGPVVVSERPSLAAMPSAEPEDLGLGNLAPRASADEARIWTASSMSGMKPGLAYLIPIIATVVVGLANALLLGPGIGWPTGVALVVSSLVGALRIRLADASVAVIAPPLAFLAAAATAGQVGMSMAGGPVIAAASNLFFALSSNVPWIVGATVLSLAVVLIRTRRDRG